jgi:DNA-binding MarR family transcriptional regulator
MHAFDDEVRGHTRRHEPKQYLLERLSDAEARRWEREHAPGAVASLAAAGAMGSALRRALRARGIDPKLARLVLLLYEWRALRVSEIAWRLNVSTSTASRHVDRAERRFLVDKLYQDIDRRGTWARLTKKGRVLRLEVETTLASIPTFERPAGRAFGSRATDTWDP